jgi:hypothetical protein
MKKTLLLSTVLFLVCSAPGVSIAQPLGGTTFVNPLVGTPPALVNGRFHFHITPLEDHPAFESLDKDSYQYHALHGYEHYRGKDLQQVDRFRDIQYPKDQPDYRSSYDSFFGVESSNPLRW